MDVAPMTDFGVKNWNINRSILDDESKIDIRVVDSCMARIESQCARIDELAREVTRLREIEKRYVPTGRYFLALCPKCKWVGTSELCGTGDYFAQDGCECPKCGHDCDDIEQTDSPGPDPSAEPGGEVADHE